VGADYPSRANTATVDTDQTTPTASNTVTVSVGVPITTATAVTAGVVHTCALLDEGTVKCWGNGVAGQLGYDSTANVGDEPGEMGALPPVNLGAGRTATAVTAGYFHTCALLDNATVKCWGNNGGGQLGQDSTDTLGDEAGEMAALPPVNLGAGRTATTVTAGAFHTCALLDNATVKCWGNGDYGQLGQDSTDTLGDEAGEMGALPPVNLGAGRTATAVTAGYFHTCALLDNATVKCWGYGASGQLGQGSTANLGDEPGEMAALPPVNLGAGRTATAVTAGYGHTCALLDNATVKCWGYGDYGQLGQDSTDTLGDEAGEMAAVVPVDLGAGRTATAITAAGVGAHTCALLDNATVKCWGNGGSGQLGQDSTDNLGDDPGEMAALAPVNLGAGRTATATAAGANHTCARLDNATVKCWGNNDYGQLGQDSIDTLGDEAGEMAALPPIVFGLGPPASAPGLSVVKSADEASVPIGASVHLHVSVTNTGNVALNDVTIDDPNGPDCEAAPFDLAVGADLTVDCTHVATAASVAGGYHNTASVTSDEVTTAVVSNTVDVTVTITPGSGLTSGTVTETGSGTPIPGVVVAVLDTATFRPVAIATTNAAGQYFVEAPPGTYYVYAVDPTQDHTAGFHGAPTLVVVTEGNTTAITDVALPPRRGTLAGTVTDTGGPVAGVLAMSIDLANGQPGAGDLTDNTGAYSIPGLVSGSRLLEFIDLSATHPVEFYDNAPQTPGATILNVTGAGTITANADLATQAGPGTAAHLTGQVTATVGGNLEGVAVLALRTSDFGMAAADLTDGTGSYDIALDAGTYKLAFYDPSGTHLFEWHDNLPASPPVSATTVTATAGTPLVTNAALTPATGVVSGAVTETGTNASLANVFVVAVNTSGAVVGTTTTAVNGTYTLANLPVGSVRIRYVDLTGTHAAQYHDNSPDYAAATLLPITAGSATPNLNAALTPIP